MVHSINLLDTGALGEIEILATNRNIIYFFLDEPHPIENPDPYYTPLIIYNYRNTSFRDNIFDAIFSKSNIIIYEIDEYQRTLDLNLNEWMPHTIFIWSKSGNSYLEKFNTNNYGATIFLIKEFFSLSLHIDTAVNFVNLQGNLQVTTHIHDLIININNSNLDLLLVENSRLICSNCQIEELYLNFNSNYNRNTYYINDNQLSILNSNIKTITVRSHNHEIGWALQDSIVDEICTINTKFINIQLDSLNIENIKVLLHLLLGSKINSIDQLDCYKCIININNNLRINLYNMYTEFVINWLRTNPDTLQIFESFIQHFYHYCPQIFYKSEYLRSLLTPTQIYVLDQLI